MGNKLIFKCMLLLCIVILVDCSSESHHSVSTGNSTNQTESHSIHVIVLNIHHIKTSLVFTCVLILAGAAKLAFNFADYFSSKVPESCMLIVVGTILGAIIEFSNAGDDIPTFFEPNQFFMFLLPPIILESSFSLHDRTFVENLGSILLFAVVGTILACFMLGGSLYGLAQAGAMGSIVPISFVQMLVFTSLIVAVDPVAVLAVFEEIGVNHVLYFLVFGESLLNDGVTVVIYNVMQSLNLMEEITIYQIFLGIVKFFVVCFGGLAIGVSFGLLSALFSRLSTRLKVVQPIIIYGMAYLGFLMAELFEFSGIISIIGCGLVQVHYSFQNIHDKSRLAIKYFTKVFSTFSEVLIFLFLGLSFVRQTHVWHTGFILWTLLLCLVYRFIITFAMSFLINKFDVHRVRKIGLDEQFIIAYGGLRGAVCFSLVALLNPVEIPQKDLFLTATLSVIVFTGFIQGITIKPLVNLLQISLAPMKDETMYLELNEHITDHMMAGIEDVMGFHGKYYIKEKLEHIDDTYLKKFLLNVPRKKATNLMGFYEKIMLKEHLKYLKLCNAKSVPDSIPKVDTKLYLRNLDDSSSSSDDDSSGDNQRPPLKTDDDSVVLRNREGEKDLDASGLRSLLQSIRTSRTLKHTIYDRNLKYYKDRRSRHNLLRDKNCRNRSLQRVMSSSQPAVLERTISWDDNQTDIRDKRIKDAHVDINPRSISVDMSQMAPQRVHFDRPHLPSLQEVVVDNRANGEKGNTTEDEALLHSKDDVDDKHHMARQNAVDEVPMVEFKKDK